MLELAAARGGAIVLMHMQGTPKTMQDSPTYTDVVQEVEQFLCGRAEAAMAAGVQRNRILLDPGIGFAKTAEHNADVLESIALYHGLGCPVLVGPSRKSFIANFSAEEAVGERLPGSIAAAIWGASQGVQALRVHDVAETTQALAVWRTASDPSGPR